MVIWYIPEMVKILQHEWSTNVLSVSMAMRIIYFEPWMQLPDSMKHSQADLYLETYQVLDLEMSRLREIQRWQASAASKVIAPEMALWIVTLFKILVYSVFSFLRHFFSTSCWFLNCCIIWCSWQLTCRDSQGQKGWLMDPQSLIFGLFFRLVIICLAYVFSRCCLRLYRNT